MKDLSVSDVAQWFAGLSEKQKFQVDREFHEITGGTLSAFASPKPVAVALVPVATNEGLRLLGIRRGISPARGKPTLPGGFLEKDESPRAAAAREVHEEVGLDLPMKYFVEHGRATNASNNTLLMFFRSTIVLTLKQFQELQEGLEKSGDAEALELMLIDHDTELGFYLHHAAAIQFFASHA